MSCEPSLDSLLADMPLTELFTFERQREFDAVLPDQARQL